MRFPHSVVQVPYVVQVYNISWPGRFISYEWTANYASIGPDNTEDNYEELPPLPTSVKKRDLDDGILVINYDGTTYRLKEKGNGEFYFGIPHGVDNIWFIRLDFDDSLIHLETDGPTPAELIGTSHQIEIVSLETSKGIYNFN